MTVLEPGFEIRKGSEMNKLFLIALVR